MGNTSSDNPQIIVQELDNKIESYFKPFGLRKFTIQSRRNIITCC